MVYNHKRETLRETVKLISKRLKLNNFPSVIKSLQEVENSADLFNTEECTTQPDLS